MENQVATVEAQKAVVVSGPSSALSEAFNEIKENLTTIEDARLPRLKMRPDGIELHEDEESIKSFEGTILHLRRVNQYYEATYDENNVQPPDCFSLDGITPEPGVPKKQSEKCMGCPKAEWGSSGGGTKKGKACRNMKPLYILMGDDSIMPRQLTVPPTSLKAVNGFLMTLTERGIPYHKAKIKVEAYKETPKDTYCRLKFTLISKLDEQRAADVKFLKQSWAPIMDKQLLDRSEIPGETPGNTEKPVNAFTEMPGQTPNGAAAQTVVQKKTTKRPDADAKGQF